MWKQKVGISVGNSFSVPTKDIVALVAGIGFEAVSLTWDPDVDLTEPVETAGNCGLAIQSLHAPFRHVAAMWEQNGPDCANAKQELLGTLEACAKFQIPIMVAHPWKGFGYTFPSEELNFANYDNVVAKAKAYGVKVAFENTEGEEYLFALMDRYRDEDAVGFCWDSGHEMCYNRSRELLCEFGDRLLITHLNDNLGIRAFDGTTTARDDLHLLPYDGIADWDRNIELLRSARCLDILNLEVGRRSKKNRHENDSYAQMPLEVYFTEAYTRACRIAYRYSR